MQRRHKGGDNLGDNPGDNLSVPGFGGGDATTHDGQQALRLHGIIAIIACALCIFVTVVFAILGSLVQAVIFGVLALVCLGILGWATRRRAQGRAAHRRR